MTEALNNPWAELWITPGQSPSCSVGIRSGQERHPAQAALMPLTPGLPCTLQPCRSTAAAQALPKGTPIPSSSGSAVSGRGARHPGAGTVHSTPLFPFQTHYGGADYRSHRSPQLALCNLRRIIAAIIPLPSPKAPLAVSPRPLRRRFMPFAPSG